MKIDKIIVDKMPTRCPECIFYDYDFDCDMECCVAQNVPIFYAMNDHELSDKLPTKCLLVEKDADKDLLLNKEV